MDARRAVGFMVLCIGVGVASTVWSTAGDLDPTFGANGIVVGGGAVPSETPTPDGAPFGIAVGGDGSIIIGGAIRPTDIPFPFPALAKYHSDGTIDLPFGLGGMTLVLGGTGSELLSQPDGKVILGGGGGNQFALTRYLLDGTLDATFGTGGTVRTSIGGQSPGVAALANGMGGTIIACGTLVTFGQGRFVLVRYERHGTLDSTFGTGGMVTTSITGDDFCTALVVQPDGSIIAAGNSLSGASQRLIALVRYDSHGNLDPTFGTGGMVTNPTAFAVALLPQPGGRVVVGGNNTTGGVLLRYDSNGTLDSMFGMGGVVATPPGTFLAALRVQEDQKIVTAGGGHGFVLTRYRTDGTLDPAFGSGGLVETTSIPGGLMLSGASALALQADGKLLVGGSVHDMHDTFTFVLARYRNDPRCGDGFVDPGEACDDGNTLDGDCCSASCDAAAADGTPCDDSNACTTADVCGSGVCRGASITCPTCEQCDRVVGCLAAPRLTCRRTGISQLTLSHTTPGTHDRLNWMLRPVPVTTAELGDPRATDGYSMCVFDETPRSTQIVLAVRAPAGGTCGRRPCWTKVGSNGFQYRNPSGNADGLTSLTVAAGPFPRARVRGVGPNLPLSLPLPLPVDAQLQLDTGACRGATFSAAGVSRNTSETFKGKAP